jgi:hypothetical protein
MHQVLPRGDAELPVVAAPSPLSGRRRLLVLVLAVGGLFATALATAWVGSAQGLYVGKVEVVVHPPRTEAAANPLASPSDEVVRFAALIAEVATNGEELPRVTNQDLTLADQGMRHDTLISLVNLGGQWANDFSRPFIRVEAVDESPDRVEARLQDGIAQVTRTMERMQDDADVPRATRTTAEVVPAAPQVRYEPTHRDRAMLVTMLVGLLLTTALCRYSARKLSVSDPGAAFGPIDSDLGPRALSISGGGHHHGSSRPGGPSSSHNYVTREPTDRLCRSGKGSGGEGDSHGI